MDALIIIITAIFIAGANGLLGSYLILRKSVMIGDAISHAVLPGLVIGFFISGTRDSFVMLLSAALSGLLCAFLIQVFTSSKRLPKDASTGLVFTFLFAVGVILITLFADNIDIDPDCVLHGEIGYVTLEPTFAFLGLNLPATTLYALGIFVMVLLFIRIFKQPLFISSFDPDYANAIGLSNNKWDTLLMGLTAATTVVSFNAVGAILVVAFMVIPAASAYLITKSLNKMLLVTMIYAIAGSIVGFYVSRALNSTISSAIVTVMGAHFLLTFIFVLWRKRMVQI